jgi:hypothetical protein
MVFCASVCASLAEARRLSAKPIFASEPPVLCGLDRFGRNCRVKTLPKTGVGDKLQVNRALS